MLNSVSMMFDNSLAFFAAIYVAMIGFCALVIGLRRRRYSEPLLDRHDVQLLGTLLHTNLVVLAALLIACDGVLLLARAGEMIGSGALGHLAGLFWIMGLLTFVFVGRYPGTVRFSDSRVIDAPPRQVWDAVHLHETTAYFDPAVARIERIDDRPTGIGGGNRGGVDGQSFRLLRRIDTPSSDTPQAGATCHGIRHQLLDVVDGRYQRSRMIIEDMIGEFSFADVIADYQVIVEVVPELPAMQTTRVTCTHKISNVSVLMLLLFLALNAPRRMLHRLAVYFEATPVPGSAERPGSRAAHGRPE